MNQNRENERNASSSSMKNPDELTETLKPHFENVSLSANINPTVVLDVKSDGILVGAPVHIDRTTPLNGFSLPEIMWDIAVRAKKTDTLEKQSDEMTAFFDHKGCPECASVIHDPDHDQTWCPDCDDAELSVVNVPDEMHIKEKINFPETVTPVQTNDELEQALRLLFDTTDISL